MSSESRLNICAPQVIARELRLVRRQYQSRKLAQPDQVLVDEVNVNLRFDFDWFPI